VHVLESEESDDCVEAILEVRRWLHHVCAVQWNVEPASIEHAKALQQYRREIESFNRKFLFSEEQSVPAHPAADIENSFTGTKPGNAGELVDVTLEIGGSSRNEPALDGPVVITALIKIVGGDCRLGFLVHCFLVLGHQLIAARFMYCG